MSAIRPRDTVAEALRAIRVWALNVRTSHSLAGNSPMSAPPLPKMSALRSSYAIRAFWYSAGVRRAASTLAHVWRGRRGGCCTISPGVDVGPWSRYRRVGPSASSSRRSRRARCCCSMAAATTRVWSGAGRALPWPFWRCIQPSAQLPWRSSTSGTQRLMNRACRAFVQSAEGRWAFLRHRIVHHSFIVLNSPRSRSGPWCTGSWGSPDVHGARCGPPAHQRLADTDHHWAVGAPLGACHGDAHRRNGRHQRLYAHSLRRLSDSRQRQNRLSTRSQGLESSFSTGASTSLAGSSMP